MTAEALFAAPFIGKAFIAAGKAAYAELQRHRMEQARQIILKRLKAGQSWAISQDQGAAALFAYLRAAEEGAARRNLELIAEVLTNAAVEGDFDSNEFRRHTRHLAELSREEAIALGVMMKSDVLLDDRKKNPWQPLCDYAVNVTSVFADAEHFSGVLAGLMRTGYVRPLSLYGAMGFGTTREMVRLARLVDIEDVVRKAEADGVEG